MSELIPPRPGKRVKDGTTSLFQLRRAKLRGDSGKTIESGRVKSGHAHGWRE